MVGFVRSLSRELAPYGITANAVYPGGATRMTATVPDSTRQLREQQRTQAAATVAAAAPTMATQGAPIQGPDEARDPDNNAPKAVYLCTEAAGSITGQVIGTSGWPMTLYLSQARHQEHPQRGPLDPGRAGRPDTHLPGGRAGQSRAAPTASAVAGRAMLN